MTIWRKRVFIVAAVVLLFLSAAFFFARPTSPEDTLRRYLEAVYARDFRTAYQWISKVDRKRKSEEEYLRENPSFSGASLELTRKLAGMIEWRDLRTEIRGDSATVYYKVRLPNANAPEVRKLFFDFDLERLARLSEEEEREIAEKLDLMREIGSLPTVEGEDSLELIKENGRWRVLVDWSEAIPVKFRAEVKEGLPWEFRPVQEVILAKPGETLQAIYKARNLADRPITAKARHLDEPKALAEKYLEIVQCFCFIQQTLAPGEEKELPLIFRVLWDTPDEAKEFRVTYEFYPIEKFPQP